MTAPHDVLVDSPHHRDAPSAPLRGEFLTTLQHVLHDDGRQGVRVFARKQCLSWAGGGRQTTTEP